MFQLFRGRWSAGEREVVALARSLGLQAERTRWLPTDLEIEERPYEVKRRHNGLGRLYQWLGCNAGLFLRQDGQPWLVVLPAEDFLRLLGQLRKSESSEPSSLLLRKADAHNLKQETPQD